MTTDFGVELNLLTHMIVMGVDIQKEEITYKNISEGKVGPTFLDIFPSLEGDTIPAYIENFKMWGFIEGFKIYNEKLKVLNDEEETEPGKGRGPDGVDAGKEDIKAKTKIYSFVMTDQNYCKRYCTTLLFHEKYYVKKDEAFSSKEKESTLMPKSSLQDMYLKYPYTMKDHDLIYLPKSITLVSTIPCFDAQKQILRYFHDNLLKKEVVQHERTIRIPKKFIEQFETLINKKKQEPLSADIDDVWKQTFSYDRNLYLKGQKKTEEYSIKETHLREFYISAIFSLLDLSNGPVERTVSKLHNEENEEELVRFRINKAMGVDLPPIGYKPLFRKLSAKNIVKIFKAILLERQIIFFSSTPGEIPYITEAFLSLLSPMMWCCIYIPYMSLTVWEVLHAIMPFIAGVATEYKEFISNSIDLKDKVVVDLDHDTVECIEMGPPLPKKLQDFLISKIEELHKTIKNLEPKKGREVWVEVTLKCRHYFNLFLLGIINNIIPFFIQSEQEVTEKQPASEVFEYEDYFQQFTDLEGSNFARELFKTMMFTNFIEESYLVVNLCDHVRKSSWEDQIDEVSTFLSQLKQLQTKLSSEIMTGKTCLNVLHPKAVAQIDAINSQSIQQATQRYYNPEKIDLLPYLIKYYYRFFFEKEVAKQSHSNHRIFQPLSPMSRGHVSPIRESFMHPSSSKETMSINKSHQVFPPLNKAKIVDMRKVFLDEEQPIEKDAEKNETIIKANTPKLPIFSEPKPIYQPRETQNEVLQLMNAQKDNFNMPLIEPPINNPSNLLRKSNYFLYYQMFKRNEVISPEVRRVSEYEFALSSPDRKTIKSQNRVLSNSQEPSHFTLEDQTPKMPPAYPIFPLDQGFSSRHGSFFKRQANKPKVVEDEKETEESKISNEKELYSLVHRSATDKGPETKKKINEDGERISKIGKKKEKEDLEREHKLFQVVESDKFLGANPRKNPRVLERQGDSPLDSPVLKSTEEIVWAKTRERPRPKAKSERKIFELKRPMKRTKEDEFSDTVSKPLLNRSVSENGNDLSGLNLLKMDAAMRKIQSTVPNLKVNILKGDLDPVPPVTPNRFQKRMLGQGLPLPSKDLSIEASPEVIEDKKEDSSWEKIGHEGEEDSLEEEWRDQKGDNRDKTSHLLIKNLDTGEMIPLEQLENYNVKHTKTRKKE